ncbi:MAG: XRE family transcriptional regulator [Bacteroidales bacterium]|nr:XRE family transcriptional regulator [Bacteroidales bacterium]
MSQIKREKQYKAMMARIDELFFDTDENTPADDPRLLELDLLSSLVEEYEKEHFPINPAIVLAL